MLLYFLQNLPENKFLETWFSINWEAQLISYSNSFLYLHDLLPISIGIFLIGFLGFSEASDFVTVLINTELMLLGINFYLITLSVIYSNYLGQVYALCFLSLTAAETAVGLGLLITLYRIKGSVQFVELTGLKY